MFTKEQCPVPSQNKKEVRQSEFPLPTDKVLYIDLDGTLIDSTYQITSPQIQGAIQSLQQQGWLIGLSSDTPLEPLRTWRQRFGMNGDIIAERGCILEINGVVYDNRDDVEMFRLSLEKMKIKLTELGCRIWSGDTVEFIRSGSQVGDPGDTVILINEHRTQSIGLYVRQVGADGQLRMNIDLTNQTVDAVRSFFPTIDDLNEDLNHDYGILILSRKAVFKRVGTTNAMAIRNLTQVGMIGNSITDFVGSDIAMHYAVANASDEFKQHANYVANQTLTNGVVEILNQLGTSYKNNLEASQYEKT